MLPEYWSASCGDVTRMVDENIKLRPRGQAMNEFKMWFVSPSHLTIEDSLKEVGISDVPFDFQMVSLKDLEHFATIISKRDACYEIAQSQLG